MLLAVVSDTHLGARSSTDSFGHDDGEFLRFLRELESSFDRIVLLGDIWETLTSDVPGRQAKEFHAARASHREIAERFQNPKYHYVYGNHDWVAGPLMGARDELLIEDRGTRILFTHGHQREWAAAGARLLSEAAVWCGGWMLRLGLGRLYRFLESIDSEMSRRSSVDPSTPFQRWAFEAARQRDVDVIVTGHTHHAARTEKGSHLFLNSGTCSQGRFTFSALDTSRGEYSVHASGSRLERRGGWSPMPPLELAQ